MQQESRRKNVICVGDLNFDVIASLESSLRSSHDMFLSSLHLSLGGGAANVAVGLARLGITSILISRVGRDQFGTYLIRKLGMDKVQTRHIQIDPSLQTGFVVSLVSQRGERTLYSFRGANLNLNYDEVDYSDVPPSSITHISGYSFLQDPQRASSLKLIEFARRNGWSVSVDLGPELNALKRSDLATVIRRTNLLFISHNEGLRLYRTRSWIDAIDNLLAAGPDIVVLKSGQKGCYVGRDETRQHVQAFEEEAVDTTGAGDAFNSGFIFGMTQGWSINKAASAGNAVAAMKIRTPGAVDGLPMRQQLVRFLQKNKAA